MHLNLLLLGVETKRTEFSWEVKSLQGDLVAVSKYLMGGYRGDGARALSKI